MKTCITYIPYSVDIDRLLRQWPHEYTKNLENKFCYVLGLPYHISRLYGNKEQFITDGYVPINVKKLREMGVREGNKILEYFKIMQVFETDGYYIPGEKSRYYRFTDYLNGPVDMHLIGAKSTASPKSYLTEKRYNYLSKWLNEDLTIEYVSAGNHILKTMENTPPKEKEQAIRSGNIQLANIADLLLGNHRFHIDDTGYRLHTIISNLRSDIRPFLKYNGEVLVSCDIKNSQLFLLLLLLNKEFYDKMGKINIYKYLKKEEIEELDINTIKMTLSLWDFEYQNIELFTELCRTGKIYEYLMEIFSDSISAKYRDRNKTKKALLWALFEENYSFPKERELFEKAFPPVGEICTIYRMGHHELLPILLQRIESDVVLNKSCKKLSKLIPDVPIYTIHDSIITTEGNEVLVKNVLEEELSSIIGIKPTIKIEPWG